MILNSNRCGSREDALRYRRVFGGLYAGTVKSLDGELLETLEEGLEPSEKRSMATG